MSRPPVNPGRVDWSGENPGIYLKEDPAGDYTVLALFFRVVLSPHGRGAAAIVLGDPDRAAGWPDVCNFILTDNQSMMRWIVDGWVRKMPTFRGRLGLEAMTWLDLDSVSKCPGNLKDRYSESLRGDGLTLEMIWKDLGEPMPIEVTKEDSATGEHEMYSVFLEAKDAEIRVNNSRLRGKVAARQMSGQKMGTAFLAFSETWVTPDEKAVLR